MAYRISVDVGGTFPDVVVTDTAGRFIVGQGLTDRPCALHRRKPGSAVAAGQTCVTAP